MSEIWRCNVCENTFDVPKSAFRQALFDARKKHFCPPPLSPTSDTDDDICNTKTSGDDLYCVQWMNLDDAAATPTSIFKIGRGTNGREQRVHGTNPVKYPLVRKYKGAGYLEKEIHALLESYRVKMNAGREWFNLKHVGMFNIGRFIDDCVLKALCASTRND